MENGSWSATLRSAPGGRRLELPVSQFFDPVDGNSASEFLDCIPSCRDPLGLDPDHDDDDIAPDDLASQVGWHRRSSGSVAGGVAGCAAGSSPYPRSGKSKQLSESGIFAAIANQASEGPVLSWRLFLFWRRCLSFGCLLSSAWYGFQSCHRRAVVNSH